MRTPKAVQALIDEWQKLPSIGPKSAARLTYWLLRAPRQESQRLAQSLIDLKAKTRVCRRCYNIGEDELCAICADSSRDQSLLMVVEEPLDVLALERTGRFTGIYHVLNGVINPVAGVGPEELRINELLERVREEAVREVILATNPTMEGEATALYLKKMIIKDKAKLFISRLARGLPTGGDLEYADQLTITRALEGRHKF